MASDQERIAILFIHGILGTTSHFEPFLSLIPPNWSICNLSLKGHGGSVKDFSQASMTEWKQQVKNALEELSETNNKIIIVDVLLEFFRILSFSDNNVEKSKLSLVPSVKICSCNCATLYSFNKSKGLFIIKPPKSKVAISYAYFEA